MIGVNQSTINRIKHGRIPSYTVGKALIDAAQEHSRKAVRAATKRRAAT